jgi:CRISPR-associated protein Cmr4
MFQKSKALFLICETPLHAGSGDSLGIVDLPIQRERHTGFPKIEASSLKGALREAFEQKFDDKEKDLNIITAFGREDGETGAAALGFTDARLLLFPIKSAKGVFAWITCSRVLQQLQRDFKQLTIPLSISGVENSVLLDNECFTTHSTPSLLIGKTTAVLEEYAFKNAGTKEITIANQSLGKWLADKLFGDTEGVDYWKEKLEHDILILKDDDFKDFVNLSTEVITRIKIDNKTGTVAQGQLFTEEYLPSESVLYSLVLASPEFSDKKDKKTADENMKFFNDTLSDEVKNIIQLGGNATLGKGILRTKLI